MTHVLPVDQSLLIRTDYSDDEAWRATVDAANQPWDLGGGAVAYANLTVVEDPSFDGMTLLELKSVIGSPPPFYVFVADELTMTGREHLILAIDTHETDAEYPSVRVHPAQMASVENNLSLANLDFADFASSADTHGVFRGFSPPPEQWTLEKQTLLDAVVHSALPGGCGVPVPGSTRTMAACRYRRGL